MKKYRVFIISLICIAGAIGLVFSFYVTPTMAQKLDNNINNMMDKIEKGANSDLNTQLSSNPYDYAKDNEYFQNIVDMGYPALSLIEETISKSQNNGLREYLLAIAAEEIAKVNLKTDDAGNNYQWETAKGFV